MNQVETEEALEAKENKSTTHQCLWKKTKARLTGRFIGMSIHLLKKKSDLKWPMIHLKVLGKQKQATPPIGRKRRTINIREEIKEWVLKEQCIESDKQALCS